MTKPKTRNIAIDVLKVLAVFVVLNSHMELCYGDYAFLATGGAIGDALFFFCSGFVLFRGQNMRFDNYMKRRISRIYPTVFIVAIIGSLLFGEKMDIITIILSGGGWFVNCIMIYYVLLWFVKKYGINHLKYIWILVAIVILASFYLGFEYDGDVIMYGETYFKWAVFFCFMLQGAVVGLNSEKHTYNRWSFLRLIFCIIAWYLSLYLSVRYAAFRSIQYLSIVPLLGVTYFAYKMCCAPFWKGIYNHKYIGELIYIIGGLCLECYLIQGFFITDKLNFIFPLNILIITIFILAISYLVNFFSNSFSQTFRKEEYDWSSCFLRRPKDA